MHSPMLWRAVGLPLGWPRRVPRSTAARHAGGAARLISLRHPWLRSNRRPLGGGLLPHAMTALKFGARFLSITRFHRSGVAGLRSRRRSRPLLAVPRPAPGGIRASSPAGETWMSEQAGADLPEARDGEGQLSKDALRSPVAGAVLGTLSRRVCDRRSSGHRVHGILHCIAPTPVALVDRPTTPCAEAVLRASG